jgi:1-acyl-sn-glycerol-3-phosphate acyltransferase
MIETLAGLGIIAFARLVTGARGIWMGCTPTETPRVYFANHTSHGDAVLIWTVLPPGLRRMTRPVAGSDYWLRTRLRRFFAERVFRAVLIDRQATARSADPVQAMVDALSEGASLIVFPEGTRNTGSDLLLPFKTGLYHVAKRTKDVEFVPVWIDNPGRVMPKGEFLPVPLLCTTHFGAPLILDPGEDKQAFMARTRNALLAMAPNARGRLS